MKTAALLRVFDGVLPLCRIDAACVAELAEFYIDRALEWGATPEYRR